MSRLGFKKHSMLHETYILETKLWVLYCKHYIVRMLESQNAIHLLACNCSLLAQEWGTC